RGLARPCASPNGRHPIRAMQDVEDRFALFLRKHLVLELVCRRRERLELPAPGLDKINEPPFLSQHLIRREPLMPVDFFLDEFIPQKLAFDLVHVYVAHTVAKRLPKQFLVRDRRGAFITVTDRKLHRFHFCDPRWIRYHNPYLVLYGHPFIRRDSFPPPLPQFRYGKPLL